MSNSSTNSQRMENVVTVVPPTTIESRPLPAQVVRGSSSGFLSPPTRISSLNSPTSTFQNGGEKASQNAGTGNSNQQQQDSQPKTYTGGQFKQNTVEGNMRYSSEGSYGLQTVGSTHQIPEEVRSNRNSVQNTSQPRLSNSIHNEKKRLENFEYLPLDDLLNDNIGFDRSKHVPTNPSRTTIRQSQTSQVIPGSTTSQAQLKSALESTKDTVQAKLNNVSYDLGIRSFDNRPLGDTLRTSAHNAKEALRNTFDYATKLRHSHTAAPVPEGFRRSNSYQPPVQNADQGQVDDEKDKNQSSLMNSIGKLVGSHMMNKLNNSIAKSNVDLSDSTVVLVASAVMTTMMLLVFWLLIRQ